ncbi:MAG: hypothetical protein JKY37_06145 [Nannocystaceae bacterium]|nr:hypothetical protein [Nannocystaceae bacterium]
MGRILSLALVSMTLACASEPAAVVSDLALLATATSSAAERLPQTREEFLRTLSPLPFDAVRVTYAVQGPGGLAGTLEILLASGGRRRESWTLALPLPGGDVRTIAASAVQTADYIWTGTGEFLEVDRAPLGALADAYLKLPEDERRRVVESLDAFRSRVSWARVDAPGPGREVLGMPCLETRLAAQELCIWEATGLPLDYRGNAFAMQATTIETDARIPEGAFSAPMDVQRNAPAPDLDPAESLSRLARQDYGELGPLLHPGLRLPLG